MTSKTNIEMRVGLFVLLGVLILALFVFSIGDHYFYKPGYHLRVTFKSANGIVRGAPVHYAGVGVGKVDNITIHYEGEPPQPTVEVLIWLPVHVQVRHDDRATISTFGLLGEKYLDITPRYGRTIALHDDDLLAGSASVSTEELTQQANRVLEQLGETLNTVNTFFDDEEVRSSLRGTLRNAQAMTDEWRALGLKGALLLDRVERGEGSVGKLFFDQQLYDEVLAFVRDLRSHPWKLLQKPKDKK